mmetsp:Transcript_83784/g.271161  ORF Transcript_83784/g.271161 Transcript_83784/m.271161 type:complete len:127 (-) Transcript_83784:77-457(-)
MDEFKGSSTSLVADVDCTADGKELCEKHSVQGYPSIKWGDPSDLKDYDGGRSFDDLKKFADENLGPTCGPDHIDLCSDAHKKKIESYMAMSQGKLEGKVQKAERTVIEDVPLMKKTIAYLKSKKEL